MNRDIALPYTWYPLAMTGAICLFALLAARDAPAIVTTYTPVIAAAVFTLMLQRWWPERRAWRPRWTDVRTDALFMLVVQVLLPDVLLVLTALSAAGWMHAHLPSGLWPHAAPLPLQLLLMIVTVDLGRYWLHRACHRYALLWRLHAVHHAPTILYSLNVARFHPLEKALQFCIDTLPFVGLGVAPEVMALHYVVYSVNGLFQHSNARLRYGWLNYVIGSAETHRWHHARDPRVAACNFGNTTMLWDLLFGTFRLPARKTPPVVGIDGTRGRQGFREALAAPFRRGRGFAFRTFIADALVQALLRLVARATLLRIGVLARDPMRAQRALLARIVRENRGTIFGRKHAFASIAGYAEFAAHVPVHEFEDLRELVDAEITSGATALTSAPPVHYARTSGTTSVPKDIPLTASYLRSLRNIQRSTVALQHRVCPAAFEGAILALVSPAIEGTLPNGKPFGSCSGIVAGDTPALVRTKFVLPREVLGIADSHVKYMLILRLALARADVTYIGAANSTTLLALIRLYREHQAALVSDLRHGSFHLAERVPPDVWKAVRSRLMPCADRADRLERMQRNQAGVRIADLWPALRLVVTWTCGSAGVTVNALRRELNPCTRILELGYVASEFRATITAGRLAGSGFPTIDTHFFEFAECAAWDRGERALLTLDRVRKGVDYYVVVTTPSGLYRYFINDIVRVRGFLRRTPLLQFVQKGKGVTNLTGEKLYESQVLDAVRRAMQPFGGPGGLVMALADEECVQYRVYVEVDSADPLPSASALAPRFDELLRETNIEYRAKRDSSRLGAPVLTWLRPGAGDAYRAFCVRHGQREGQFKIVALAYRRGFPFDLEPWTVRETP